MAVAAISMTKAVGPIMTISLELPRQEQAWCEELLRLPCQRYAGRRGPGALPVGHDSF
jgi:hypothetical protein